jgi:putative sterol carrier protein
MAHIDDEAMTSPMEDFLTELGRREHEPLLAAASGTIRFDVHRGGRTEYRLVRVDRGKVSVTKGKGKAEAVVDADGDLLDLIAEGQVNAMAAVLRGALHVEGDPELLIQLQRAFPGPSNPPGAIAARRQHARRASKTAPAKRRTAAKAAAK